MQGCFSHPLDIHAIKSVATLRNERAIFVAKIIFLGNLQRGRIDDRTNNVSFLEEENQTRGETRMMRLNMYNSGVIKSAKFVRFYLL